MWGLCTGCKTCMIACKDKNDLPEDVKWRRVTEPAAARGPAMAPSRGRVRLLRVDRVQPLRRPDLRDQDCPTTAMHKGRRHRLIDDYQMHRLPLLRMGVPVPGPAVQLGPRRDDEVQLLRRSCRGQGAGLRGRMPEPRTGIR